MADDPIKLFATRAERYPEPTDADLIHGGARAALAAMPVIGGTITEVLSMVLAPTVSRRRDEWLKELAEALDRLEREVEGFKVENLARSDTFVSAVIQATRAAAATHQHEKLEYLRNALLNIALGKTPEEIKQQVFLNAVEAFSPAHVKILHLVWRGHLQQDHHAWWDEGTSNPDRNCKTVIDRVVPELKDQIGLLQSILADLRNRGFSDGILPEDSFPPFLPPVTNFGVEFLRFVLSAEDIPK
jgi:hypothetical protein